MASNLISIEPRSFQEYEQAVIRAGGVVSDMSPDIEAVIWTDYSKPQELAVLLANNSQVKWVQLPFAGVDAFSEVIKAPVKFTSAKGAYREPVAEHALALALALGRKIPVRVKASSWGKREAVSFYDSSVVLIGGGGISQELVKLLTTFRCDITLVRNDPSKHIPGTTSTVSQDHIQEVLPKADLVIIACALTSKTRGMFNFELISKMKPSAFLVNVARGPIIVTSDLIRALEEGVISGAALDVTDPEPLPENHTLFGRDNLIITPHTADTKEIVTKLFAKRVEINVRAYLGRGNWEGLVDPTLGY